MNKKGFTLLEMLAGIIIIVVLGIVAVAVTKLSVRSSPPPPVVAPAHK